MPPATPHPARSGAACPWFLLAALAWAWAILFPLLALANDTVFFADGGLFSLAIVAGDSWAWHWRNIAGRVAVYLLAVAPAEQLGDLLAAPRAALAAYALLFNLAPLASLALVRASRAPAPIMRACHASTALLLPFVFAFPTEIWVAHAALWPAIAFATPAEPARVGHRPARLALSLALILATALSHEAGMVWLLCLALLLAIPAQGERLHARLAHHHRPLALIALALLAWILVRATWRPDAYTAEVLDRNAWVFLDPARLLAPVLLLQAAALLIYLALARAIPCRPVVLAVAVAVPAAASILLLLPPHGWDRYYLRTLVFVATPTLMLAALHPLPWPLRPLRASPPAARPVLAGAVLLLTACHAAQTLRFLHGWSGYRHYIAQLSQTNAPASAQADPDHPLHRAFGWNSTTPFLSILLHPTLDPPQLVTDPTVGYFWFSCATARHTQAPLLPARTRAALRAYACSHRQE